MRSAKDEPSPAAARDFKVLVADDSRVYRKLVEDTLSDRQYALLFAKTGREAIDLFSEHQPALVITDCMMPDLSGIELCEHIRKQSAQPYTYLIILTGITEKPHLSKDWRPVPMTTSRSRSIAMSCWRASEWVAGL
jgi:CheY-like chemotaxis protein